jgi:hypothetical protein
MPSPNALRHPKKDVRMKAQNRKNIFERNDRGID